MTEELRCPTCKSGRIATSPFRFLGNASTVVFGVECPDCGAWTRSRETTAQAHNLGDTSYRDEIMEKLKGKVRSGEQRLCPNCGQELL
jgi:DNA-directed RNA polymerase subunit RPC12/RpoP